jgi:hypothetical protein
VSRVRVRARVGDEDGESELPKEKKFHFFLKIPKDGHFERHNHAKHYFFVLYDAVRRLPTRQGSILIFVRRCRTTKQSRF